MLYIRVHLFFHPINIDYVEETMVGVGGIHINQTGMLSTSMKSLDWRIYQQFSSTKYYQVSVTNQYCVDSLKDTRKLT